MQKTPKIPPKTVKYTEKIGKKSLDAIIRTSIGSQKDSSKWFEFADFCDTADFFQNTATTLPHIVVGQTFFLDQLSWSKVGQFGQKLVNFVLPPPQLRRSRGIPVYIYIYTYIQGCPQSVAVGGGAKWNWPTFDRIDQLLTNSVGHWKRTDQLQYIAYFVILH